MDAYSPQGRKAVAAPVRGALSFVRQRGGKGSNMHKIKTVTGKKKAQVVRWTLKMEAGLFGVMEILYIMIEVMMVTGVYKFVRLHQNISKSIVNKVSF